VSDGTKISWTDASWPVTAGCEHVSEGCEHCYAAKLTSGRLKHLPAYSSLAENGRFNGQVRLLPDRLDWPQKWRKPRKVFVADMSDLFYDQVPDEYIAQVFAAMALTPRHTYQILTKRHARVRSMVSDPAFRRAVHEVAWNLDREGRFDPYRYADDEIIPAHYVRPAAYQDDDSDWWPLPNVWLGVSVENQHWADIRIPALLDTPAAVRFVSAEPLLGPIDFRHHFAGHYADHDFPGGFCVQRDHPGVQHLDWVIVGGESGLGHRPVDIAWLESAVAQCKAAGVAVWVKQDSGPRAGQQGRIPDDLWIHEFPDTTELAGAA
jgi:protein gp37